MKLKSYIFKLKKNLSDFKKIKRIKLDHFVFQKVKP